MNWKWKKKKDCVLNLVGKEAEEDHRIGLKHLWEVKVLKTLVVSMLRLNLAAVKQLQNWAQLLSQRRFLTKLIKCMYMMKVDYMYLFQS